jgi:hypothetical protein
MKTLGIKEIHDFISTELKDEITERYYNHEILSEADLQSNIWQLLFDYFQSNEQKESFTIHCNHYLKELRTHPDLVIFKNGKPYIIIELKEWRAIDLNKWSSSRKKEKADNDIKRLLAAEEKYFEKHRVKRGYFMYVSWKPVIIQEEGIRGKNARFLSEIRFVKEGVTLDKEWKKEFSKRSKYIAEP